jgi:hypothetical protein
MVKSNLPLHKHQNDTQKFTKPAQDPPRVADPDHFIKNFKT